MLVDVDQTFRFILTVYFLHQPQYSLYFDRFSGKNKDISRRIVWCNVLNEFDFPIASKRSHRVSLEFCQDD